MLSFNTLRYIHNNPVKASIVNDPSNYKWSSYNIYINKAENEGEIISTELILNMFSENKNDAIRRFEKFTTLSSEDGFIDIEELEKNVENITVVNAKEIAEELGEPKSQNIIILGALVKALDLEDIEWKDLIKENLPKKGHDINIRAFERGLSL